MCIKTRGREVCHRGHGCSRQGAIVVVCMMVFLLRTGPNCYRLQGNAGGIFAGRTHESRRGQVISFAAKCIKKVHPKCPYLQRGHKAKAMNKCCGEVVETPVETRRAMGCAYGVLRHAERRVDGGGRGRGCKLTRCVGSEDIKVTLHPHTHIS
jgi:hypothetical protein